MTKTIEKRLHELLERAHLLYQSTNDHNNYPGTALEDIYMYLYFRQARMLKSSLLHILVQKAKAKLPIRHEHLDYLEKEVARLEEVVWDAIRR